MNENDLTVEDSSVLVCFQFLDHVVSYGLESGKEEVREKLRNYKQNEANFGLFKGLDDEFVHPGNILKSMMIKRLNFEGPRSGEVFAQAVNCLNDAVVTTLVNEWKGIDRKGKIVGIILQDRFGYFQDISKIGIVWFLSLNHCEGVDRPQRFKTYAELAIFIAENGLYPKLIFFEIV